MRSIILIFIYFVSIQGDYQVADELPLVTIVHDQRNVTLYTSASNPSREPKEWLFWYDPLFVFNSSKDIHQYNEQIRFQFSIASKDFDEIARKMIISKMHPDVGQSALFWIIEPLPIDTLTIYIVDQTSAPVPAVYPCIKTKLFGMLTFECQFLTSSMAIASSLTQRILCGKLRFQLEYYIKTISVPKRLTTRFNLQSLRSNFGVQNIFINDKRKNLWNNILFKVQQLMIRLRKQI